MSQDPQTIRWGIIGPGRIARTFASDLAHAEHASLNAVASRQLASARGFAREFNIERAYGSYAELFNDPDIDAVYIATTSHLPQRSVHRGVARGQTRPLRKTRHRYPRGAGRSVGSCRDTAALLYGGNVELFFPGDSKSSAVGRCGPDRNSLPCQG